MGKPKTKTTARAASKDDPLARYRDKRDFAVTPEPSPELEPAKGNEPRPSVFVIQRHDARRLHYDVRIEVGLAMMSFAVPKGPSYDPTIKRLAVEVEDHPLEYNAFEGSIPKGEYGGGDVVIWDRGTYETVPRDRIDAMRIDGEIKLRFFGEKLRGEWHFVRTGDRVGEGAQWLMFKKKDRFADPKKDIVHERPESVVSGPKVRARALLDAMGDVCRASAPREATLPSAKKHVYEIKYDGYRLLCGKHGDDVRLESRASRNWTDRFEEIADAVAALAAKEAVIDGEACAVDARGAPSFHRLQRWLGNDREGSQLVFAVFDLLWLDGEDLRRRPLEERRALLGALLDGARPPLVLSKTIEGDPKELMKLAAAQGLEGLIAKRRGSPYTSGPTNDWIKMKCERRQDFAVIGYVPLTGFKHVVGALILGVIREGKLSFSGKVGTGLDDELRRSLAKELDRDAIEAPVVSDAERYKGAVWCTPRLVVEVGYVEWSPGNKPRHPTLIGVREDKKPEECRLEAHLDELANRREIPDDPAPPSVLRTWPKPTLSNRDKVLFPRDGVAKRDVWDYYAKIAKVLLPHLAHRPINLQRWPHGIDGTMWFQHRPPEKSPPFVRLLSASGRGEERVAEHDKVRIIAENVETLQWLANLAALTFHQWASHTLPRNADGTEPDQRAIDAELAQPDYSVIDLDPGDGTWAELVEVAFMVKKLLDALEMESVVKTSGKRGVHIVVPLGRGHTHAQATSFAEEIARAVAKQLPKIATVERIVAKRGGRLYVDFGQNGGGRTIVSPYTIRAVDGATVSCPIKWEELTDTLDPRAFTIRTVLDRVEKYGDLFAPVLRGKTSLQRLLR